MAERLISVLLTYDCNMQQYYLLCLNCTSSLCVKSVIMFEIAESSVGRMLGAVSGELLFLLTTLLTLLLAKSMSPLCSFI